MCAIKNYVFKRKLYLKIILSGFLFNFYVLKNSSIYFLLYGKQGTAAWLCWTWVWKIPYYRAVLSLRFKLSSDNVNWNSCIRKCLTSTAKYTVKHLQERLLLCTGNLNKYNRVCFDWSFNSKFQQPEYCEQKVTCLVTSELTGEYSVSDMNHKHHSLKKQRRAYFFERNLFSSCPTPSCSTAISSPEPVRI